MSVLFFFFFFFNDTATTEIYTLSLHDALPISELLVENGAKVNETRGLMSLEERFDELRRRQAQAELAGGDRKSTRLNSSHSQISYAVFCLKKKKKKKTKTYIQRNTKIADSA